MISHQLLGRDSIDVYLLTIDQVKRILIGQIMVEIPSIITA